MKIGIGPIFNESRGVNQHILAIKKYSSNNIIEIPPKFIRRVLALDKTGAGIITYEKLINPVKSKLYDIVHSHVDRWFVNLCLSSRKNFKWVHTYHILYFAEDWLNGLDKYQQTTNQALIEVASKADVRISVSKWLHDYLLNNYAIETEVIYNGFDSEVCDKANRDRFEKKYAWGDFVLFVGAIEPVKNPQLFVQLAAKMPDMRFVMIGQGLNAARLGKTFGVSIPSNLVLMDEVKHEVVLDAMSACKVFVMTSRREGIPTTLLEAMYLGKPAVVPAHSGCKEVVASDEYGFLFEPDSLNDLFKQTQRALVSNNIGQKARERVSKLYDWKILAKQIDAIYERTVNH
jgi:glycosyltransferase involved in cell wall biosynthesis